MSKMVFVKGFDTRSQAHAWIRNKFYNELRSIGIIVEDDDVLSYIMKNHKHHYKIVERIEIPVDTDPAETGYGEYRVFLEN